MLTQTRTLEETEQRRRRGQRRRWKAVHFPLFDSNNQLVTKNRRHNADRRVNANTNRVVLRHGGTETIVTAESKRFVLGRSSRAGLVINSAYASRMHARIECRGDMFVVTDLSKNGTYVVSGGRQTRLSMGQECELWGDGKIALGEPVSANADKVIGYSYQS